jgi:hypothetical protein
MTDNNWPDPARPGVPMNPERDGWHWVADKDGIGKPWVEYWNGRDSWAPVSATPNFICWHWRYIAPVLTPAEVEARVAQARRDALEEAARAMNPMLRSMISRVEAFNIIRALKGEGDE